MIYGLRSIPVGSLWTRSTRRCCSHPAISATPQQGTATVGNAQVVNNQKHFNLTVYDAGNNRVDLETQFHRLELCAGL